MGGKRKLVLIALGVPALLLGYIVMYKLVDTVSLMRALDSDTRAYGALHDLRRQIQDHKRAQGRFPADLSGLNVHDLEISGYGRRRHGVHHHRISGVELRPGAGLGDYTVMFSTEIFGGRYATVAVLGDFNGYDPVKGAMRSGNGSNWYLEATLPRGSYTYKIAVNGRAGPAETVAVSYELQHPNVRILEVRGFAGDSGKWLYDPQTGLVFLGCSGRDTKGSLTWYTR